MRFRLIYRGELKAAGTNKRVKEKWEIRKQLHPQLLELWNVDPRMKRARQMAIIPNDRYIRWSDMHPKQASYRKDHRPPEEGINLYKPHELGGRQFIPLVCADLHLVCSLDILFLRKGAAGSLVHHDGDLDNRLKTLFDGLRMPTLDEIEAAGDAPSPMFCLLQDDALISEFAVRTDRLLTGDADDVHLVMDVNITATDNADYNRAFWS